MTLPPYSTRPTLRVDLAQVKANYEALKALTPRAKVAASVKADAYGLGLEAVGRALYGTGCRIFFVATAGEGKMLRDAIGPNGAIYVLNGPAPRDKGTLLGAKLKPVISTMDQARYWAEVSREVNDPPYTAIHIDTGMNRLGLSELEVKALAHEKELFRAIKPDWVISHLACSSITDHPMNAQQLVTFKRLAAGLPETPLSLANTAGIYLGKNYHFQMVRPGIGLYGGKATDRPDKEVGKSVVKMLAPILQVRYIKAGETIGYDASYTATRDMRLAVVGAGYADGVPVALSNKGHGVIHDQPVPVVGRVSMDVTTLDTTDIHLPVQVGGVVEFLGDHMEERAREAGTINYELLARLGQRVRRDYWKPRQEPEKSGPRPSNRAAPSPKRPASNRTASSKRPPNRR
jgi:alanine racemase